MSAIDTGYQTILNSLKQKIILSRQNAVIAVNTQLLQVYREIGFIILQQQQQEGWGKKVIARLAKDLKAAFPDMKGFSERNLVYMQTFAAAWPHFPFTQAPPAQLQLAAGEPAAITQAPLAQLSWYHHVTLLDKVKDKKQRLFYLEKAIENGWSRNVMLHQIESQLHLRQANAITNFDHTLPKPQSNLARETFKNPYLFEFLNLTEAAKERELEKALIQNLKQFMLELGKGFAYRGNQKNIVVNGNDFFLDLLFYNTNLHCYVIFELKVGDFEQEFAGKLNFYVNTINGQLKTDKDGHTIGVLLCKTSNDAVVKYSLQGIQSPIGVASYHLANTLPKQLKSEMPTAAELGAELDKAYTALQKPVDQKLQRVKNLLAGLGQPPVKEKLSAKICESIFTKVAVPLWNGIKTQLNKDISALFEQTETMIWIGTKGFETAKVAKTYLKEQGVVNEIQLSIRLRGCKAAGTKAFDIWKDISINMSDYNYNILLQRRQPETTLLENLYHELPDKATLDEMVDKIVENILDDIEGNVKRISG